MNCNAFESELRSSIERHDTADRLDLREHVADCERCREAWEQQRLLDRAIAAWTGCVPAVDLADRVMARWAFDGGAELAERLAPTIESDAPAAQRNGQAPAPAPAVRTVGTASVERRFDRRIVVAAAVAVLAILLSPLVWRPADSPPSDSHHLAGRSRPNQAEPPRPVTNEASRMAAASRPVRLDTAVRDAGSAWLGLASEATGTVREMAAFLPERTLAIAIESANKPSVPQTSGWTERLQDEIKPIGRDVGKAMDFLLEAVPLDPAPAI